MKTVLGNISANEINAALCHEHICCYSEYLHMMSCRDYLDVTRLVEKAVSELKELKLKYGLNLFVDCTPINIGRNIELLKSVSEKSGCYIGLDRMYDNKSEEYINKKVNAILRLCDKGLENKILLSHDESFFNGFEASPKLKDNTRFSYVFEYIRPRLPESVWGRIIRENPIEMLEV